MYNEDALFDESNMIKSNMIKGKWAKFENIGDKISGTYIGKRTTFNQLRGGDQTIYELLTKEGEVWNVGSKPMIDEQMKYIKFGQIVGFQFVAEGKVVKPGMNPAKIIKIFARPDLVDKEWLENHDVETMMANPISSGEEDGVIPGMEQEEDEPFPSGPSVKDTSEGKRMIIEGLAKAKLGVSDSKEIENAVMNKTKLAFMEVNYDEIIKELEKL